MRTFVAVGFFVAVSCAWGGSVPIANAGFDDNSCGAVDTWCAPNSWTVTGSAGAYLPPSSAWDSLPGAPQVGWSNGGTLTQILTSDLLGGETYTLSVWVSERINPTFTFTPVIELLAGSTPIITMNATTQAGNLPQENVDGTYTWVEWTGTYTSPASGGLDGQPLEVLLGASSIQSDFDSVTLDAEPVTTPEPAMFSLIGAGLLGLVARTRTKSRRSA